MSNITTQVDAIIEANSAILEQFFIGIASCDYYDGLSHQLYLDTDDNTLSINTEVSDNTWLQRDDGSLIKVAHVNGDCDTPEDERYTDECSLSDYGYSEWLDEIRTKIEEAIS